MVTLTLSQLGRTHVTVAVVGASALHLCLSGRAQPHGQGRPGDHDLSPMIIGPPADTMILQVTGFRAHWPTVTGGLGLIWSPLRAQRQHGSLALAGLA